MKPSFLSLTFVFSLAFLSSSRAEEIQRFVRADREIDGLLGPVKSVEWFTEELTGETIDVAHWGKLRHWKTFEYDRQGRRIQMSDGREQAINHFDDNGRLTYREYSNGKSFYIVYDKNGHRVEERYLDQDGNLISQSKYKWIPSLMADFMEYSKLDGSSKGLSYWYYDERGNDVCRSRIDSSQDYDWHESISEYDENNNVICYESRTIDQEGNLNFFVQHFRRTEEPISIWLTRDIGIVTEFYEYEYDDRGNWILKRTIAHTKWIDPDRRKEISRMHRKIEYYE